MVREEAVLEKSLQVSCLPSEAVHCQQMEFLRQISVSENAAVADPIQKLLGTLIPSWLGRLAFPPNLRPYGSSSKAFHLLCFPSFDLSLFWKYKRPASSYSCAC